MLADCGRGVREDVRLEEERLNPNRAEQRNSSKLRNKVRSVDERRLRRMITAAGCDGRNCASMLGAIRVGVNELVQLR
jgi:hypothetical protein